MCMAICGWGRSRVLHMSIACLAGARLDSICLHQAATMLRPKRESFLLQLISHRPAFMPAPSVGSRRASCTTRWSSLWRGRGKRQTAQARAPAFPGTTSLSTLSGQGSQADRRLLPTYTNVEQPALGFLIIVELAAWHLAGFMWVPWQLQQGIVQSALGGCPDPLHLLQGPAAVHTECPDTC